MMPSPLSLSISSLSEFPAGVMVPAGSSISLLYDGSMGRFVDSLPLTFVSKSAIFNRGLYLTLLCADPEPDLGRLSGFKASHEICFSILPKTTVCPEYSSRNLHTTESTTADYDKCLRKIVEVHLLGFPTLFNLLEELAFQTRFIPLPFAEPPGPFLQPTPHLVKWQ
ncbi:uncharacterized protein LOC126410350 [Nymphaea colorata]|uniref:uncharacterized protein LOC126410350 n=1 Tax=Nymphaea colorata TaxID=210225 RepID=UPI00214F065C|nr:uncharacterized protein LOC126410350 [Nymphaea colorata]